MPRLKIAQLASYRGNVGDQANVVGTRRLLAENLGPFGAGFDLEYTDVEYLEYEPDPRWGGRKFDDSFVDLANGHDLLMIGGGGFFELAVDRSATGTPIDISIETMERIKTPVVFYALGFDISVGLTSRRVEKFRRFLAYILDRPGTLVSVRNDGSRANLHALLGEEIADRVDVVPDGGFFTEVPFAHHPELPDGKRCIAVNLAGDGLAFRFGDAPGQTRNFDAFLARFAAVLNELLARSGDLHVVIIPHIPEDLPVAWRLLAAIGPPNMRARLTVAPYLLGRAGQDYVFDAYRACKLAVGMRFHANVCPIGLGVPTIALVTHPQIAALYDELDMPHRALRALAPDFADRLKIMIAEALADPEPIRREYGRRCRELRAEVDAFHERIAALVGVARELQPA